MSGADDVPFISESSLRGCSFELSATLSDSDSLSPPKGSFLLESGENWKILWFSLLPSLSSPRALSVILRLTKSSYGIFEFNTPYITYACSEAEGKLWRALYCSRSS